MSWLDRITFKVLILVSILLGLAPWSLGIVTFALGIIPAIPEPHVVEKLKMLFDGSLSKPIDIFDLFMHGTPWVLLGLKSTRHFSK